MRQLLGDFPTPYRGSAPGLHWGLPSPRFPESIPCSAFPVIQPLLPGPPILTIFSDRCTGLRYRNAFNTKLI